MPNESDLYGAIRKSASKLGGRLFRNNVGLFMTMAGNLTMGGLPTGSSDLIGWMPKDGLAVFSVVEIKSGRNKTSEDQDRFIIAVRKAGGFACVARSVEEFETEWEAFHGF